MKVHGNIKCDCGHTKKDHYQDNGWCHHSAHPEAGKCGCTWFHPNRKYIRRKNKQRKDKQNIFIC